MRLGRVEAGAQPGGGPLVVGEVPGSVKRHPGRLDVAVGVHLDLDLLGPGDGDPALAWPHRGDVLGGPSERDGLSLLVPANRCRSTALVTDHPAHAWPV